MTKRLPPQISRRHYATEAGPVKNVSDFLDQASARRPPKPSPSINLVDRFVIHATALRQIERSIGRRIAEQGGALIGDPDTSEIIYFIFDEGADTNGVVYQPNIEFLNDEIEKFERLGLGVLGIAHSHPPGFTSPSIQDLNAAYNNITSPSNAHLLTWHLPIIQTIPDIGRFGFHPYIVSCSADGTPRLHRPSLEISGRKPRFVTGANVTPIKDCVRDDLDRRYARVSTDVDFGKMMKTTVIAVGCGASGKFLEEMCRLGIKRFHLFDPDHVERHNLAAQNFQVSDVGTLKVEALKERLLQVEFEFGNPDIQTLYVKTGTDFMQMTDNELDDLVAEERKIGHHPIFLFMTDRHVVQARGSRLALRHKVPTFWAGIYSGGGAGELIFWYPGYNDLPCYRCITQSRYGHHALRAKRGFAARSSGLPFAASFLDALLGHLVVGAIHHDLPSNRHGLLMNRLLREGRNFVQVQLDPNYLLGNYDIFEQLVGPDVVAFNSLFQRDGIKPDCKDCGNGVAWTATDYTEDESVQ